MSTQLIICLVIFVLTCVGYMTGVWSLATVAMTSISALALTGCLSAKDALAYFSNNNVIMIGAMSVVAAGFNRTQFCTNLANAISKMAKGSLSKVLLMYCILAMLLSQMVQSPVVVFGIVAPLCLAFTDTRGIARSKAAMSLGVVSISTCCTLPIGNGATQAAEFNSYIAAFYEQMDGFSGTVPVMGFLDPMKGRLPMLIFAVLYCALIMPRFCPDRGAESAEKSDIQKADEKTPLSAFSEVAGIVIFFAAAIALMLQASILSFLAVRTLYTYEPASTLPEYTLKKARRPTKGSVAILKTRAQNGWSAEGRRSSSLPVLGLVPLTTPLSRGDGR